MLRAVFFTESRDAFERVYDQTHIDAIAARTSLNPVLIDDPEDPALSGAEALFTTWGMHCFDADALTRRLPELKCVFYAAGSVQAFARPLLARGVRVFSAAQANAVPVAEFAFAQIVLALKGYFPVQAMTRADRAGAKALFGRYPGAYGVKVGLLGCGAIGSRVAERLKGLDVEVLAYDPFLSAERTQALNVRLASLEEVFSQCMVVSNHLANLPATVGLLKREHLLSMPPLSTFINTGRGPQLDEGDLYDALTADPSRCALLDVLTDEECSVSKPLNALPNCFITPHIAGSSGLEVHRMARMMVDALDDVLAGRPCACEVLPAMLETMA